MIAAVSALTANDVVFERQQQVGVVVVDGDVGVAARRAISAV